MKLDNLNAHQRERYWKLKYKMLKIDTLYIIFFSIFLLGGVLNFVAVKTNDNLMPIYDSKQIFGEFETIEHKSLDKHEIKNFYLSDIIYYENEKERGYMSVGDILIYASLGFITIYFPFYIVKRYKLMKEVENVKRGVLG